MSDNSRMDAVVPPRKELRDQVKEWTLASDVNLLKCLKHFSDKLIQRAATLDDEVNNLERDAVQSAAEVEHCVQMLSIISTKHFMENRVYDEDFTRNMPAEPESGPQRNGPVDFLPKIKEALSFSLNSLRVSNAQVQTTETNESIHETAEDVPVPVPAKVQQYPLSSDISLFSNGENVEPVENKTTSVRDGEFSKEDQRSEHTEEQDEERVSEKEPFSDLQKELAAKLRLAAAVQEKPSSSPDTHPAADHQRGPSNAPAPGTTRPKKASLFADSDSDEDLFTSSRGEKPPPVPDKLAEEDDGDLFVPTIQKPPSVRQKPADASKPAARHQAAVPNSKVTADSDSDGDIFAPSHASKARPPPEDKTQIFAKAVDKKNTVKGLFSDDSDEDLFAGIRPPLQTTATTTGHRPLPRGDMEPSEKDLKASGKPAGGVSMFGSVDPAKMLGSRKPVSENGPPVEIATPSSAEGIPEKATLSSATAKKAQPWKPSALFSDESDDDLFSGISKKSGSGSQKEPFLPKEENNNQRETGTPKTGLRREDSHEDLFAAAGNKQEHKRSPAGSLPDPSRNSSAAKESTNIETGSAEANDAAGTKVESPSKGKPQQEVEDSHENLFPAIPGPLAPKGQQANPAQKESPSEAKGDLKEKNKGSDPGQKREGNIGKKSLFVDEESDSDADLFKSAKIKQNSGTAPGPSQVASRSFESQGSPTSSTLKEGESKEKQELNPGLRTRGEADGAPAGLFDEDSDEDLFSGTMSPSERLQRSIRAKLASAKSPAAVLKTAAVVKDPGNPAASVTGVSDQGTTEPVAGSGVILPRSPAQPLGSSGSPSSAPRIHDELDTEGPVPKREKGSDPLEGSTTYSAPGSVAAEVGPTATGASSEDSSKPTTGERPSVKANVASLGLLLTSGAGRKPIGGVSMFGGIDPTKLLKSPSSQYVEKSPTTTNVKDVGTVEDPEAGLLSCIGRERPRLKNKRKPPSRAHRQSRRNLSEEFLSEQFDPDVGSLSSEPFPVTADKDPGVIPAPEVPALKPKANSETPKDQDPNPLMQAVKDSFKLFKESSDSDEDLFPVLKTVGSAGVTRKENHAPTISEKQNPRQGSVQSEPFPDTTEKEPAVIPVPEVPALKPAANRETPKDQDTNSVMQAVKDSSKLFEESSDSDEDLFPVVKSVQSAEVTRKEDRGPALPEKQDPRLGSSPYDNDRTSKNPKESDPETEPTSSKASSTAFLKNPAVIPEPEGPVAVPASAVESSRDLQNSPLTERLSEESSVQTDDLFPPSKATGSKDSQRNNTQLVPTEKAAVVPSLSGTVPAGSPGNGAENPGKQPPNKSASKLFGESSESEDDLFAPRKIVGSVKKSDPVVPGTSKQSGAKSSLISGDSSSDDELFKPKTKAASVKVTPKTAVRSSLLSDDDDDDLFSSKAKPRQAGKPHSSVQDPLSKGS